MMPLEISPGMAAAFVFVAVSAAIYLVMSRAMQQQAVRRRYESAAAAALGGEASFQARRPRILPTINPALLGIDAGSRRLLRSELLQAGFFSPGAVASFVFARVVTTIAFPALAFLAVIGPLAELQPILKAAMVIGAFMMGFYLPKGYLARRVRLVTEKYRLGFPDFLDLLVVCVNAGLSLEAAIERVARELDDDQTELKGHLALTLAEMRAGRGTVEALRNLAERLGCPEAKSFVTMLSQSLELGADVSLALTVFSDDMRNQRMARAEQKAYALPVKLSIPLALFIFPTLLIVIATPVIVRVMQTFGEMSQ